MKHQYFGDINDYIKYALLRSLGKAGLQIGVCWMMTPYDGRSDGRKIQYLTNPKKWRSYDPVLFDFLAAAVKANRDVHQIEDAAILPNCIFYDETVPETDDSRRVWTAGVLEKFSKVDLVFFDPDNGIEVRSTPRGRKGSNKFVYWVELETMWSRCCSLLVFQHFPRQNRVQYIARLRNEVSKRLVGAEIVPIITSNVVYILAYQPQHKTKAQQAVDLILMTWLDQVRTGTGVECL
jgi:hypothetical protein